MDVNGGFDGCDGIGAAVGFLEGRFVVGFADGVVEGSDAIGV